MRHFIRAVIAILLMCPAAHAEHLWRAYNVDASGDDRDAFTASVLDTLSQVNRDHGVIEFWTRDLLFKDIMDRVSTILGVVAGEEPSNATKEKIAAGMRSLGGVVAPYLGNGSPDFQSIGFAIEIAANDSSTPRQSQSLNAIDCAGRRYRVLSVTSYEKGKVKLSSDVPSDWAHIGPDTVGEHLYDIVCPKKKR